MQRFIGKKLYKKYVRPINNSKVPHKETNIKVENKIENTEEVMNDKITKVEEVLDIEKAPKRKGKIEKKDKGLFERTENSTVLLTEDNKMLLND